MKSDKNHPPSAPLHQGEEIVEVGIFVQNSESRVLRARTTRTSGISHASLVQFVFQSVQSGRTVGESTPTREHPHSNV